LIPTLPLLLIITAVAFQPESAGLRRVFEDNLARRRAEFGAADARTAQALRDLGLFLLKEGDRPAARRALAETLRLDEAALGRSAPQTLEDAATLAGISPAAQAEPLWRRAAEATDASVAGPALTSLAAVRKSAGDLAGAATLYRRAVEKAEAMGGRDSPLVALILTQLALVAPAEEAVAALRRAVAIDQRALGPQNAQTVAAARALAALEARVKASGH
jgi:tetratricopeptide (TPR) repeat protein